MPVGHVSLPVADLDASLAFYLAALKPLGYGQFMKIEQTAGLAVKYGGPDFWLHRCPESDEKDEETISKTHVAFQGSSHKMVDAFYAAALKAGATDNGKPGERPHYVKGYYSAYVFDLDGNNIECVYWQPWWLSAMQMAPSVIGGVAVAGLGWWMGKSGFGF